MQNTVLRLFASLVFGSVRFAGFPVPVFLLFHPDFISLSKIFHHACNPIILWHRFINNVFLGFLPRRQCALSSVAISTSPSAKSPLSLACFFVEFAASGRQPELQLIVILDPVRRFISIFIPEQTKTDNQKRVCAHRIPVMQILVYL